MRPFNVGSCCRIFRRAWFGGALAAMAAAGNAGPANVALHCKTTLQPRPNYRYCTDPEDRTQLTDGVYTHGYFWVQKTTVGWEHGRPVVITLDLGRDRPIRGVSLDTAAGTAGVFWPRAIYLFTSLNRREWHYLGNLVTMDARRGGAPPPPTPYRVYRYWTKNMATHGRYLQFVIDPKGAYFFADEIEVYKGDPSWLRRPLPAPVYRSTRRFFEDIRLKGAISDRLRADLAALTRMQAPAALAPRIRAAAKEIASRIENLPIPKDREGFRAVLPLEGTPEARIFALVGAIRAARGLPPALAWGANPWDFLTPTELPESPPAAAVTLAAMRGEVRAGALNLTNCTEKPQEFYVRLTGFPAGFAEQCLTLKRVVWTDTWEETPVAAALLPLQKDESGRLIMTVPAGMTCQVWISCRPAGAVRGMIRGNLEFLGKHGALHVQAPVTVRVFDLDLPKHHALHLGGWDYTDGYSYGVTPRNLASLLHLLKAYGVDSPWAQRSVMPYGTFDARGNYRTAPDTSRFDLWLRRWPNAQRYMVFAAVGNAIAGTSVDDPRFARKVGEWIHFWAAYFKKKGKQTSQLYLLLVDEPHAHHQDRIIAKWAAAIRAAEPKVNIWEDPTYRDPRKATPALFQAADVLCPNRPMMLQAGAFFRNFYSRLRTSGKRLDFYSCSGPARLLDPYAYYRLQAWTCFEMGAEGTFFWAFGDNGNGNSWNEYLNSRTSYTPLFLAPDGATPGKHLEAIRESLEDFDYLAMLRRAVRKPSGNAPTALVARAKQLLAQAPKKVLGAKGAGNLSWNAPKDRSVADQVRIEIGSLLEKLR